MTTKTRIANKTIWSLEDIEASCLKARRALKIALDRAENKFMDPILILELARVGDALSDIERTARDARQGKYQDIELKEMK